MPTAVREAAERLSEGKAQLALELVGFDSELSAAMSYVFGSSFVVCGKSINLTACLGWVPG